MLTDLLFFVAQPGNLPPQFAAPAAAAAPGPGGTTPGYVPTSAQAAQALKQQTAELKKFWREQQAEIEQVSSASEVSSALALVVTHAGWHARYDQLAMCSPANSLLMSAMQVGTDSAEFKNHQLPLARIKKVRSVWD